MDIICFRTIACVEHAAFFHMTFKAEGCGVVILLCRESQTGEKSGCC